MYNRPFTAVQICEIFINTVPTKLCAAIMNESVSKQFSMEDRSEQKGNRSL